MQDSTDQATPSTLVGIPRALTLPTGQRLVVRQVQPGDEAALRAFYEGLDADAIYRRFFTALLPPADYFARLTAIADRGGCSLVVLDADTEVIVAEADYEPLENGNGEMAIAVSNPWRGWMGPFLLALLCQVADARDVPNLEAVMLSTNRSMRAVTRSRGEAFLPQSDWTTVRVAFSTSAPAPTFSPGTDPKILVEARSSAFAAIAELAAGGYDVMACHGRNRPDACPLDCDETCPLVESADLVILAGTELEQAALARGHVGSGSETPVTHLDRKPGEPISGRALRDVADRFFPRSQSE